MTTSPAAGAAKMLPPPRAAELADEQSTSALTEQRLPSQTAPQLYRIPDVMRLLSMSRTVIYEQLRTGRLHSVRQGRARLITAAAIADYIALLESEAREDLAG
jgi:predicted DNA-binding transcriptional regulator AlpA